MVARSIRLKIYRKAATTNSYENTAHAAIYHSSQKSYHSSQKSGGRALLVTYRLASLGGHELFAAVNRAKEAQLLGPLSRSDYHSDCIHTVYKENNSIRPLINQSTHN